MCKFCKPDRAGPGKEKGALVLSSLPPLGTPSASHISKRRSTLTQLFSVIWNPQWLLPPAKALTSGSQGLCLSLLPSWVCVSGTRAPVAQVTAPAWEVVPGDVSASVSCIVCLFEGWGGVGHVVEVGEAGLGGVAPSGPTAAVAPWVRERLVHLPGGSQRMLGSLSPRPSQTASQPVQTLLGGFLLTLGFPLRGDWGGDISLYQAPASL